MKVPSGVSTMTDDIDREKLIRGAKAGDKVTRVMRIVSPEDAIAMREVAFKMREAAREVTDDE